MKRILLVCIALISAFAFNSVAGATIASVIDMAPAAGAITANVISFVAGNFIPAGVLPVGVFSEIWTGEMIKAFRTSAESVGWYERIRSYDQYVNNDVIHFTALGGDPTVLVNNKTYPLNIESLQDADKPISLDYYDTTATPVTDDELHACSYNKMASVLERHKEAIKEKIYEKAIHAIAPSSDTTETPVLFTSGDITTDGTRKRLTFADILAAKEFCDKIKMPKKDRILVLCSEHINDLLLTDQKFKEQYNINQTEGKITRQYGFDIYEYDGTPYYKVSGKSKLAWGAVPSSATDRQASVFYFNGRMMRANGSVQFYHSEASKDTLYHRSLVNYRKWNICLPLKAERAVGAIVSALGA